MISHPMMFLLSFHGDFRGHVYRCRGTGDGVGDDDSVARAGLWYIYVDILPRHPQTPPS